MLKISKKTDYGVRFLAYLVKYYDVRLVCLQEAAEANNLPFPYLRQVARQLTKASIIQSKEGATGGYTLSRSPSKITMSEVIVLFEGGIAPVLCLREIHVCPTKINCPTKKVWQILYGDMIDKYKTTTLEAFL